MHGDFSHDARFKEHGVFCEGTGMSVYTGPGTYEEHIAFQKMAAQPTTAMMKHSTLLGPNESKKQCYILVGQSIKYEPAWVTHGIKRYQTKSQQRSRMTQGVKTREHYDLLVDNKAEEVLKSATLGMDRESLEQVANHGANYRETLRQYRSTPLIDIDKKKAHKAETLITEYMKEAEASGDQTDQAILDMLTSSNLEGLVPARDVVLRTHENN